jgi:predicted dehydrogenase
LKAKALLDARAIGGVTGVGVLFSGPYHRHVDTQGASSWRLRPEESGGGLLLDLGCHTLDILDFLLGPLLQASGSASNMGTPCDVEDGVAMQFRLGNGALGTARWNFASDVRRDEIVIEGDSGELRMATFGDEPIELRRGSEVERFAIANPPHIQEPMVATVVDELRGVGRCESTGVSAARTQWVMDVALDGYYGGRQRDFWRDRATWRRAPPIPT